MEEINEQATETTIEAAWNEETPEPVAEEDNDHTEEAASEADTADQQEQAEDETGKDDADEEETEVEDKPEETDQFTLKHLDEVKTVSRDEVVTLAQKGMDYDRLRSKSEERYAALEVEKSKADERLAIFNDIAKQSGFRDVDELAENTLAQQLAEREGIDTAAALKQVRLDRREKELAAKEQGLQSAKDAKSKVDADARAFVEKYPNVDFKTIPKDVWDKVNNGDSLVGAYGDYITAKNQKELTAEVDRLKAELEAAKKNAENKARSTGSSQTSGKPKAMSEIEAAWYSD